MKLDIRTVGDMGELPSTLPIFLLPEDPAEELRDAAIILPYAVTLAVVGLLESLMTAEIVDDLTDTPSDKNRECTGQGIANIVAGFFGGMAGCAMIGQSVINVKSGGRGRLSPFATLPLLILVLGDWVKQIPMAALVAVMVMVPSAPSTGHRSRTCPSIPRVPAWSCCRPWPSWSDPQPGERSGSRRAIERTLLCQSRSRVMPVASVLSDDGNHRTYTVQGQVFFASADNFAAGFDFKEVIERVVIDVGRAHFWDLTAVGALDKVVLKFRREGTEVELLGMNEASATIVERLAIHDKPDAMGADVQPLITPQKRNWPQMNANERRWRACSSLKA